MPRFQMKVDTKLVLTLFLVVVVALKCVSFLQAQDEAAVAEKKAAEEAVTAQKFAEWKRTLPPEQQAWETLLEQNLGKFYLPLYQREKVAGRETTWDYVADVPGLPRVLLIGDSVSGGYTRPVRKELAGIANVHRAPENCGPTSNGVKKLDLWLGDGKWDVIHVNFGLHETKTPTQDYATRLESILTRLKGTGAKVIWASTTPVPDDWKASPDLSGKIVELNAAAAEITEKLQIPVDDLYSFILPQLKETQNPGDIHFSQKGYSLMGKQVAASILAQLEPGNPPAQPHAKP
ncbi:SGNH/GDSL hydrolase family protein [Planctomicrobium sp. SH661]|uniref:SGNH/GDSL hydrolase family protein n=1 Tax=Planctomicrobium sp. SH661 TaxID=3448124 RepID=UPI003F5AE87C